MSDMQKLFRFGLTAAAALVAATMVHDAKALGPVVLEVGPHVGYGTNFLSAQSGALNPFGLGIGAKAGVTLLKSFYAGANFTYYIGEEKEALGFKTSANGYTLGLDAGYQIDLVFLVLRPYLEGGLYHADYSMLGVSGGKDNVYLAPSFMAKIPLGLWYVGADARFGAYFIEKDTINYNTAGAVTSTDKSTTVQTNLNLMAMFGFNI